MLENVRRAQYSLEAMRKAQCICEYSRIWKEKSCTKYRHYSTEGMLTENVDWWTVNGTRGYPRRLVVLIQYVNRRNWKIWHSVQFWQVGFSSICPHSDNTWSEAKSLYWDCSLVYVQDRKHLCCIHIVILNLLPFVSSYNSSSCLTEPRFCLDYGHWVVYW